MKETILNSNHTVETILNNRQMVGVILNLHNLGNRNGEIILSNNTKALWSLQAM